MKNRIKQCSCIAPYYAKGLCRKCYEKQLLLLNPQYKEKQKENSKNWSIENKEKKNEYDRQRRKRVKVDPDKKYYSSIFRKFGITEQEYKNLVQESNNCCNICDRPPYKGKRLHLDHDHKTGKIRGLLCARCNWYLHTVENGDNILEKIKNYLNRSNEK